MAGHMLVTGYVLVVDEHVEMQTIDGYIYTVSGQIQAMDGYK